MDIVLFIRIFKSFADENIFISPKESINKIEIFLKIFYHFILRIYNMQYNLHCPTIYEHLKYSLTPTTLSMSQWYSEKWNKNIRKEMFRIVKETSCQSIYLYTMYISPYKYNISLDIYYDVESNFQTNRISMTIIPCTPSYKFD